VEGSGALIDLSGDEAASGTAMDFLIQQVATLPSTANGKEPLVKSLKIQASS
jgi:hypothetical protein